MRLWRPARAPSWLTRFDGGVEAPTRAAADAVPGDRHGEMALARAGAADQNPVALGRETGKDVIVVFHVGRMAGEAFFVLGFAHRLAVDELAEAPAARRGAFVLGFVPEMPTR